MESYLIIGGSGFLGRKIVEALIKRGEKDVSTFDLVQRYHDVPHWSGDITDEQKLIDVFTQTKATTIFHTASPVHNLKAEIYFKVNVEGTKTVISACQACKIPRLVYTSSSSVVEEADSRNIDVDERMPYPAKFNDAYNESKMLGETVVLEANEKEGLLTVALRPAGIFGPGDRQVTPGFAKVIERGQTKFQIGDNTNIFDCTYIDNVVHAHLLAADALKRCSSIPKEKWALTREDLYSRPLDAVSLTTGAHRVPTSQAKPQGPTIGPTYDSEEAEKRFRDPTDIEFKPITRTKFDPFSDSSLNVEENSPLQVPGQAFIITNGEPIYFWDFARMFWREMGHVPPKPTVLPRSVGLVLGSLAEWASWLTGREPGFTRFRVAITSNPRWFNIEKSRRVLGYEPQVGLEEGIRRTVEWWNAEGKHVAH